MDELETLAAHVSSGLHALQAAQKQYDRAMWDISDPPFANLRHIHLHLSITTGKLAKLLEPQDHEFQRSADVAALASPDIAPIIADLLIHAAQLANAHNLDLGAVLAQRFRDNAGRFAPDSPLTKFGLRYP